jgi:diphthamide biosynthesis protein 2
MSLILSSSDRAIQESKIEVEPSFFDSTVFTFEEYYDIADTVAYILAKRAVKVALQFPDELLHDATQVSRVLTSQTGLAGHKIKTFILADTSYGSCCVDQVAAEHVAADMIIHYGSACLSRVTRVDVRYCLGRKALDVPYFIEKLHDYLQEWATGSANADPFVVLVAFQLEFEYACPALRAGLALLERRLPHITFTLARVDKETHARDPNNPGADSSAPPPEGKNPHVVRIGGLSFSLPPNKCPEDCALVHAL